MHPGRVVNMDAMNYGEHIGDIEGSVLRKIYAIVKT